jgi:hypothetical protein
MKEKEVDRDMCTEGMMIIATSGVCSVCFLYPGAPLSPIPITTRRNLLQEAGRM